MPNETTATDKIDFSKIKVSKDWLTAAIGAVATATIPNLVFKGFAVAGAPFLAEWIIDGVKWGAAEWKAYRKRTEPIRIAKGYRQTIIRKLKQAVPNSAEWRQLQKDKTEVDRSVHELMMHRIRFSVNPASVLNPAPPPALPNPIPALPAASPPQA